MTPGDYIRIAIVTFEEHYGAERAFSVTIKLAEALNKSDELEAAEAVREAA